MLSPELRKVLLAVDSPRPRASVTWRTQRAQTYARETRRCVKREASPPAHRGARVIGTDALRIVLILREPRDGQERKQDSEDDPNINAHQSSLRPIQYPRYKESPGHAGASSCLTMEKPRGT